MIETYTKEHEAPVMHLGEFQSVVINGEQVFFPAEKLGDIKDFFDFYFQWQAFCEGDDKFDFISNYRRVDQPAYIEFFLSMNWSNRNEGKNEFEKRRRLSVLEASEAGYPSAAYVRYIYCHDGMYGFEKNAAEALKWLRVAANAGHYSAMRLMGLYLVKTGENPKLGNQYLEVANFYWPE